MTELSEEENLFQLWMIYSSKTDPESLEKYISLFVEVYKDLIDCDFKHLQEGFSEQGPHITKLPDGILQVFGNQLHQCCFSNDNLSVSMAINLLKCLIVLCRNHDNVPLVASCEFTSYTVNIASVVIDKLNGHTEEEDNKNLYILFLQLALHFFECLYDPYFVWRKRNLGWKVDNSRMKDKPALLHVEIIPFFHECIRKTWLPTDIKLRFIHLFGGLISGSQHNALKAITPATLDVLLKILATNDQTKPTNEQRQETGVLKDLVLKCLVRMVHVIHCCSPDQRQVEVCQVMEGYMQVILDADVEGENETDTQMQLSMIGAINEMLSCQDKSALQVILVSGSTFDSFISLLQKTSLCGKEAQSLAMSILQVMSTVLAGSGNAKERFKLRVGYGRFVDVLKSLGQPSIELLKSVLNLVVEGIYSDNTKLTIHNTHAAVMLIQWLPDIQSHDIQIWLSGSLRGLCSSSHTNKMNCCNDAMISAILLVLAREKQINPTAISHLIGLLESLGTQSITAIELKQLIGLLRVDQEGNQNTYCSRLMRAMSTMARREGKEGALHFFNIQDQGDGILLPGIRKWPGPAFSFHTWLCLNNHISGVSKEDLSIQSYRRVLYSFLSNSGSGFESFVNSEGEIIAAVYNKKEYHTVTVPDTDLLDGHWHSICIVHTNSKRPFGGTSQIVIYVDGKQKHTAQLKYPNMAEPFTSCRVGSQVLQPHTDWLETSSGSGSQNSKKQSPIKSLLQSATKSSGNSPGVVTIPSGSRDEIWGQSVPLNGQMGSICVFQEGITAGQVKALYLAGPNSLTVFNDETELLDLPAKMVLHYNARACKHSHIMDLTSNQNHGQLIGQKCVTWDIKDVLNCIGGIQVLFPLLEQINQLPMPVDPQSPDIPYINSLNEVKEQEDWDVLNCIGGIQVLFPLLEQINQLPMPVDPQSPDIPYINSLNEVKEQEDWDVLNCIGGIQVLFPLLEQINQLPMPVDPQSPDVPYINSLNEVKDVLNCIGGIQVLFPLLEQINQLPMPIDPQSADVPYINSLNKDVLNCIGGIQVLFPLLEQINQLPMPVDPQSPDIPYINSLNEDVLNCIGGIQVLFPLLEQINQLPMPVDPQSPDIPYINSLNEDVLNCIGGIQVLFPLLEQINQLPMHVDPQSPDVPYINSLNEVKEQEDWVILPSSSYADTKLEQNQVAGFLTLLRNMVQTKPVNQHSFVQTNSAAVIGALLQKVNPKLIDVHVLMAVQLLVEATALTNKNMLNHLYQFILFDFRIWCRSDFPVRIGHIQYLSTIIKDDRRHFRKLFGVQYILDNIRMYYGRDCGLAEEDAKTIRGSLFSLVKYYIVKDITLDELSQLFNFMMTCNEESMVCEALDVLVSLLHIDSGRKQDQLYLLMFEPEIGEMLYGLLTLRGYTIIYYEKIVKVLYLLLKTEKVYEKSKTRLRLLECGYLGLIGLIQGFEVSGPTIKRFLEMVSFTDTPHTYNSVLAVLQLISTSGFDIKLEASRQLLSILVTKTGAAKNFAKQLGWQEALTTLFILHSLENSDFDVNEVDIITMGSNEVSEIKICDNSDETRDNSDENSKENSETAVKFDLDEDSTSAIGDSNTSSVQENSDNKTEDEVVYRRKNLSRHSEISNGCNTPPNPPNTLNLISHQVNNNHSSDSLNPYTSSASTPTTPMYLKSKMFGHLNNSISEEDFNTISRSSSASAEDLSTIAQRNAERKTQQLEESESRESLLYDRSSESGFVNESSTSLVTQSDSYFDLTEEIESRRELMSSSAHVNSKDRMLDSLGLRGSFLMDDVEDSEELCQNLLIVLFTVMWKGVEGSHNEAWRERGQVFSWLDHLSDTNQLILPKEELKRRLLEMMLHDCTSAIRDAGHSSQTYMENAVELVRLVRFFLADYDSDTTDTKVYTEMLLEDVMSLLDSLAVWDVSSGAGWQEMVHLGLSILLVFAKQSNLELCASATARLHMLVQTKLISSSAEAAYLIGHLNTLILRAVNEQTDNYSYLIPVMKALVDKAYKLMLLDVNLPSLPSTSMSPTFFDDFKTYCKSEEWTKFIDNYVVPQKEHFTENVFTELAIKTAEFWENCHEDMMLNLHKQNRERGESKLKFQSQIMSVYDKKCMAEDKRFLNITTQNKNQHHSALRQWRATKRFFTGERGAWAERQSSKLFWKLSNQENFSRMKVKLIQNYNFDDHMDASFLRDNQGIEDIEKANEIRLLSVAKEAVVAKDNIADDIIGDEEWTVISSSSNANEEHQDKEKLVLSEECELVTLVEVVKGRLEVTTTHVYFFDCSSSKEEGGEDFKWSLSLLREIHFRRYNLRRSALELFLVDQTNYFLNFQKKVRNKVYSRILSLRPPNLIYYGSRSPAELLKASGLTQKWVQREISNFEYLMQLNTIAGRTYNDLSQYPVFPWILTDYTSETLDLENPDIFRDLSKPVGALNPDNIADIQEKFENFEDPSGIIEKFHYGTHYSNAATVMHYMIRMEPFTTLHIQLQSGRFDVADRQFHSIPATWKSMYKNTNDVKELIPEFFYLPEFLTNSNEFDLGKLQIYLEKVDHVLLPKWAKSPEDFIYQHRKALESEHVSQNLHNWIDLIFGYKQKGQPAIDALNVFYYCTYEGAVDLDAVKDPNEQKALEGMINNFGQTPCQLLKPGHHFVYTFLGAVDLDAVKDPNEQKALEGMINNFGQTPCQLLKDAHPRRMTLDEVVNKSLKADRHLNVFHFLEQLKVYFVEVSAETDPLVYMSVPRSQTRSIIQHGMPDTMVTVSSEGIIGMHGWLPYDKSITNYFTFEKDPSVSNAKTKKKLACPFAPGLRVEAKLFVVSHDCKLLFSGGHWDNSLQVYNISKGRKINHICRHNDVVTCLALDYCGSHLITGSRDTTCMIWHVQQQSGVSQNLQTKPLQTLYGHDDEVTAVHLSTELDTAVSASKDGTVMIHTVRKGHYMRTLRPPSTPSYSMNIPLIAVDDMGHIVVNCHEHFPIDPKEKTSLHLYSLNGKHLHTKVLPHELGHMIIKGDHLITGDVCGNVEIYDIFGLTQLTVLPLHVPVHSLALTNGNSHLLAGLRDGKLIIIGIKNKSEVK